MTMFRACLSSLLLLGLSGLQSASWAQQGGDYGLAPHIHKRVIGIETDFETSIQEVAPEFRLIRSVETFPKLSARTYVIPIVISDQDQARLDRPGAPPLIATLYDLKAGAPIASCKAPCVLNSPNSPPPILIFYRYGSAPQSFQLQNLETWKSGPFYLEFNEVDHQLIRDECAATFGKKLSSLKNRDAEPCYRLPPLMPREAQRSGYCQTTFDVSEHGDPMNVLIEACTESIFCPAALDSVVNWIYYPAIENGAPVQRFSVESKITFRLADEAGNLIPPIENPVMALCIGTV